MSMVSYKKVIDIAVGEIGYVEKDSNSNLDDKTANAGSNNYTKYARDLNNAGYYQADKNGYDWCDMFVDWVLLKACGNKKDGEYTQCQTGLYGAGCYWSAQCYRNVGRFGKTPKYGSQIFFGEIGEESHTGIVEKFDQNFVYTIEGNTNNRVERKKYSINDSNIVGYGYMRFEDIIDTIPDNKPTKTIDEVAREVIRGDWGNGSERELNLVSAGYSYIDVQNKVNELLSGESQKTVEQLADEVIKGYWGNGSDREYRLTSAGYDYYAIQKRVNEILS